MRKRAGRSDRGFNAKRIEFLCSCERQQIEGRLCGDIRPQEWQCGDNTGAAYIDQGSGATITHIGQHSSRTERSADISVYEQVDQMIRLKSWATTIHQNAQRLSVHSPQATSSKSTAFLFSSTRVTRRSPWRAARGRSCLAPETRWWMHLRNTRR
jgi:hypothetical protein